MLEIITGADHPTLRQVAEPVTVFDESLQKLVQDMIKTMLAPQDGDVTGVGLAANQVGILQRIMIVTFGIGTRRQKVISMINPQITAESNETCVMEEGCLSLPDKFGKVRRPKKIKARWQTVEGNWCEKKLAGWDARIFLHEIDHLDGKLFVDY